jgi:carbon storage regulator CsrA
MLVLTRKIGESVSVPCCDVRIEVLRISGGQVRLGVTAPRTTEVHGSELLDRPCQSHRSATARATSPWDASCRVLLADSAANVVRLYQRFLLKRGFRARVVHTALDCVSQLREETPDVLVLDPGLPWGGGDGVLALMREDRTVPRVPTLLHNWNPGNSYPDDAAFPIVRRTTRLLGLSQMEAEIRAICDHGAICPTRDEDIVTAVAVRPC